MTLKELCHHLTPSQMAVIVEMLLHNSHDAREKGSYDQLVHELFEEIDNNCGMLDYLAYYCADAYEIVKKQDGL